MNKFLYVIVRKSDTGAPILANANVYANIDLAKKALNDIKYENDTEDGEVYGIIDGSELKIFVSSSSHEVPKLVYTIIPVGVVEDDNNKLDGNNSVCVNNNNTLSVIVDNCKFKLYGTIILSKE